jgi:hypothetical protein
MYCTSCGAQIDEGMKFCTNCGTRLVQHQAEERNAENSDSSAAYHYHTPPSSIPAPEQSSGKAVAALILGILSASINLSWLSWIGIVGLILGIAGMILAISERKQSPSGMATAGFVLSIIGTVISLSKVLFWIGCVYLLKDMASGCSTFPQSGHW